MKERGRGSRKRLLTVPERHLRHRRFRPGRFGPEHDESRPSPQARPSLPTASHKPRPSSDRAGVAGDLSDHPEEATRRIVGLSRWLGRSSGVANKRPSRNTRWKCRSRAPATFRRDRWNSGSIADRAAFTARKIAVKSLILFQMCKYATPRRNFT
jgi:hypothetical protein